MTKSKNFWAAAAVVCLIIAGFSGYSIYNRLAVHFLNDTVEIRPKPVPLPEEAREEPDEQAETAQKAAEQTPGKAAQKPEAAEPAAARQEEPRKQKAVKTIFEYKSASARSVQLEGSFSKWKDIRMAKKAGVWKAEVFILPGNYLYHFVVDGKKTLDPGKPKAPMGESMVLVE